MLRSEVLEPEPLVARSQTSGPGDEVDEPMPSTAGGEENPTLGSEELQLDPKMARSHTTGPVEEVDEPAPETPPA